jgi:ubiquinone/menaquinone biosynthesis C-methylase UbiE
MKFSKKEPYTLKELQRPKDAVRQRMGYTMRNIVLDMLNKYQGTMAMEIGVGKGHWTSIIENKYSFSVSLDHEYEFLLAASKNFQGRTSFICGDAYKLPVKENIFDVILFLEILEHLTGPVKVLEEIKRIKKKEGVLILSTPQKYSFLEITGKIGRLPVLRKISEWIYPHYVRNPGHINLCSKKEAYKSFENAGYRIIEEKVFGLYLPILSEIIDEKAVKIAKHLEPFFIKSPLSFFLQCQVYVLQ